MIFAKNRHECSESTFNSINCDYYDSFEEPLNEFHMHGPLRCYDNKCQ